MIIVCVLGVLLTVGLSALATWYDLAPVKRLSIEAAKITPSALSLRLSDANVDQELRGLVNTFNTVLDRLESAYRQMEAFSADVAHELRTPLATLISGRVSVFNPGAPIPPHVAACMFDRFFRAEAVRARAGESHGLGLAIVKAIAHMHGGSVFVEPQSRGNCVGLDLPKSS